MTKVVSKRKSAVEKISIHEAECAQRYIAIEKRLDSNSKQVEKLEKMVWGIYPFILILFIASQFGG
jgi:hypothetical protein|tara:strand:+ start:1046 stop:1243 length:198 start_codon:yes stop_codon:yes gene_type:complete